MKEISIKIDEATKTRLDERRTDDTTYDQYLRQLIEGWEKKENFNYKKYNMLITVFFVVGISLAASISAIIAYLGSDHGFTLLNTIIISTIFASLASTPFFYKFGSNKYLLKQLS